MPLVSRQLFLSGECLLTVGLTVPAVYNAISNVVIKEEKLILRTNFKN